MSNRIFESEMSTYLNLDLRVIPVQQRSKVMAIKGWEGFLAAESGDQNQQPLIAKYGHCDMGLLTGAKPAADELLLAPDQATADALSVKYWQIQHLVKNKAIPTYSPFNSRRLVKLSDIRAHIDASRQGGAK